MKLLELNHTLDYTTVAHCAGCGRPMLPITEEKKKDPPIDITDPRCTLFVSGANKKTSKILDAPLFNLSAGRTCTGAGKCYGRAVPTDEFDKNGKPVMKLVKYPPEYEKYDDPEGEWRKFLGVSADEPIGHCFAAQIETQRVDAFLSYQRNTDIVEYAVKHNTVEELSDLLVRTVLKNTSWSQSIFRIHGGGDFKWPKYLHAWILAAKKLPMITFYTYTTSLPMLLKYEDQVPSNFSISLSDDPRPDWQKFLDDYTSKPAGKRRFKKVTIVHSPEEAEKLGLDIDLTDEFAVAGDRDFALISKKAKSKITKIANTELKRIGIDPDAVDDSERIEIYKKLRKHPAR